MSIAARSASEPYPAQLWIESRSSAATFPPGRRGYDPASVDEHLRRVADGFEAELQRPAPGLSAGASEQVRKILEAAESSAVEMRAKAGEDAAAHVARVRTTADGMVSRLDELSRELNALVDNLRTVGERLSAGLAALQQEVQGEDAPPPEAPAPAAPPELPNADDAGARLIALNMALSGVTREETARYLDEHFTLADAAALLDDVYAQLHVTDPLAELRLRERPPRSPTSTGSPGCCCGTRTR